MALILKNGGSVTVTTAGTPVQLSSLHIGVSDLLFQPDENNTGNVYLGSQDTVSDTGVGLCPGLMVPLSGSLIRGISEEYYLDEIWVDSDTNGNVVRFTYSHRR